MTVVNPKSISGINSITTGSGSDDILTIHTNNGTERLRIDSTGTTKIVTGIVTTLTATTGIVTTLTANTTTHLDDVTFTGAAANVTWDKSANVLGFADNANAYFGTGNDLRVYHTGSHSYIENTNGDLIINGDTIRLKDGGNNETLITAVKDGAVELYHNNVKRFETDSNGVRVVAPEGARAELRIIGDEGDDNNDYFKLSAGEGTLKLQDASNGSSWEDNIVINAAGSVELYHNNTKKFETHDVGTIFTEAGSGTSQAAIKVNTTLDDYGVITVRDRSDVNNQISGFQVENASNGSDETNLLLRSVNLGTTAFAHGIYAAKSHRFGVNSNTTPTVQIDSDGLKFNNDQAAVNALDDYEEGTFTPTMTYNTLQQAPQGTFSGQYQKVGNCVHFQARFALTDEGSGIDNIRLSNLPFTPNTSGFTNPIATFFAIQGVNIGDSDKMIIAQLQTNQYVFYTIGISDGDNYSSFNMNQIVDTAIFGCYGHYYTSS